MTDAPSTTSSLVFQQDENVVQGFARILEQLAIQACLVTQHSQGKLSDSVHNTRILIKRLRALLWFAWPAISSPKMIRAKSHLRYASHLLAAHRDLVVTRSICQMLSRKTSNLDYRKTLIQISCDSKGTSTSNKETVQALQQAATILLKSIKEIELQVKIRSDWPDTSDRVAKAFHVTKKTGKKALKSEDPVQFHVWRKKAKRLFYLLQLTQVVPDIRMTRLIERVEELQARLGDYHDSVVVQDHLQKNLPDKATPLLIRHSVNFLEKRKLRLREDVQRIAKHIKSR